MTNQDIIYLSKEDEKRYKNKLDTAELIKQCYKLQCKGDRLTPEKLYALCQLTWWTKKYFEDDYWMVAKLPALWLLWSKSGKVPKNLNDLSELNKYGFPLSFVKYAEKDTGMVNYYNAYRNSSKDWIRKNFDELAPLIHSAAKLKSEKEAIEIAEKLEKLERIPKQNNYKVKSNPSNLLTPLIACLDPRLRFPIVNKNNNVKELHRKLHITNSTISEQYKTLIGKINQHGIKDALFLDVASAKLVKLKSLKPNDTSKPKPSVVSIPLAFKNDSDLEVLFKTRSKKMILLHNKMTNSLRKLCAKFKLEILEGPQQNKYDVLIKNFDGSNKDLLIEVKSSIERAHLRLAVGQLFDYRRKLGRAAATDIGILLPEKPKTDDIAFLNYLGIKLFWFSNHTFLKIEGDPALKRLGK